jgi:hypothetical protein
MVPSLPRLRIPFPDWIAGLAFDHATDYEDPANGGQPGAGVSLAYVRDIRYGDIYEYTRGINSIGSGIESTAVAEEFTRSMEELAQAAVQVIPAGQPGVLTIPGEFPLDWFCAACWLCKARAPNEIEQERWFESSVCVTAWNGSFIKIRLSQYLGQAFGSIIRANAAELDQAKLAFTEELLLQFVGTVADLLRGVQTRDSIHILIEEDRRRREAEYAEEKKRTNQRVQQEIREGKLCPKCGFGFAWDGLCCGHCHYLLPAEEIGQEQVEQRRKLSKHGSRKLPRKANSVRSAGFHINGMEFAAGIASIRFLDKAAAEPGVAPRPGPHSCFARHHAVAAAPAGELVRSAGTVAPGEAVERKPADHQPVIASARV